MGKSSGWGRGWGKGLGKGSDNEFGKGFEQGFGQGLRRICGFCEVFIWVLMEIFYRFGLDSWIFGHFTALFFAHIN